MRMVASVVLRPHSATLAKFAYLLTIEAHDHASCGLIWKKRKGRGWSRRGGAASAVAERLRRSAESDRGGRRADIEDVVLLVEAADKQVSRFSMNREVLAEMLAQVAPEAHRKSELQPSDALARAMREDESRLPTFQTKEELFDALEASD